MHRHEYFDLWLHDDEELALLVQGDILERVTLHEWPLSCVEQLTMAVGCALIEHYQTEFELTDVRLANGHAGAPITMVPVGRNMFDAYCRGVVLGNILPDPDPPGGVVVEEIWGNLISRHGSAPR